MSKDLLTTLELGGGVFKLDTRPLLQMAIGVMRQWQEDSKLDEKSTKIEGVGSLDNPYKPKNHLDWLSLAFKLFEAKDCSQSSYFIIKDRLIKYRHQDKYISDYGNLMVSIDEEKIRAILNKKEADKLADWVDLNKERIAFVSEVFGDLIINLPKKLSKKQITIADINQLLEFVYRIYRVLKGKDTVTFENKQNTTWIEIKELLDQQMRMNSWTSFLKTWRTK